MSWAGHHPVPGTRSPGINMGATGAGFVHFELGLQLATGIKRFAAGQLFKFVASLKTNYSKCMQYREKCRDEII